MLPAGCILHLHVTNRWLQATLHDVLNIFWTLLALTNKSKVAARQLISDGTSFEHNDSSFHLSSIVGAHLDSYYRVGQTWVRRASTDTESSSSSSIQLGWYLCPVPMSMFPRKMNHSRNSVWSERSQNKLARSPRQTNVPAARHVFTLPLSWDGVAVICSQLATSSDSIYGSVW
jgi:hypothetical protein